MRNKKPINNYVANGTLISDVIVALALAVCWYFILVAFWSF